MMQQKIQYLQSLILCKCHYFIVLSIYTNMEKYEFEVINVHSVSTQWKISDYAKHTDTHSDFIIYQCNRESITELDMVRVLSFPPSISQWSLVVFQLKIPHNCQKDTSNCKQDQSCLILLETFDPWRLYICKTVLELRKLFKNLCRHHNVKSMGQAGTWEAMGKNTFSWSHNQEVNPEAPSKQFSLD